MDAAIFLNEAKFDSNGLVAAIVQDYKTNKVLMVAYMNKETLEETLRTGNMVFWSRSRKKRWLKGETSGNVQLVKEARIDCDGDALVFKVEQKGGAACHTGYESCFYRVWRNEGLEIDGKKVFDPEKTYGKK